MLKNLILAVTLAAMTAMAYAQTTQTPVAEKPATTPRARWNAQEHFHTRVAQMREDIANLPPGTTGTIVMLGDSITEQFFRQKQMPSTVSGLPVLNQGSSGDQIDRPTSGTGITHRVNLVKDAKPAIVFVMIGVNDFWGGKEQPADVLPQYEKMFNMLKSAAPDAKFVWQSVLPTSKDKAHLNEKVDQLNRHIATLASQAGDTYLDLHPLMEDDNGQLKSEFTNDGVHLTPPAYQAWLKSIRETIQKLND